MMSPFRARYGGAVGPAVTIPILVLAAWLPLALGQSQAKPTDAEIPSDLLPIVQKDLGRGAPEPGNCFDSTAHPFEKMIHSKWLALNRAGASALLVEGLAPCFAGNDNGAKLIYTRLGNEWRRIFKGVGDTLEVENTNTNGWRDLILWQHDNAYRSARQFCRFDGSKYKPTTCKMVEFKDEISPGHPALHPPKYSHCTQEFLDMKPE